MTYAPRIRLARRIKHAVAAGCGRAIRLSGVGRRFFAGRMPIVFYHGIWPAGAPALARFEGMELDSAARRSDDARRPLRLRQPGGSPELQSGRAGAPSGPPLPSASTMAAT